jgi:hypothetical protein
MTGRRDGVWPLLLVWLLALALAAAVLGPTLHRLLVVVQHALSQAGAQ